MGFGIDIRIDANCNGRHVAQRDRHLRQHPHFRFALNVKLTNTALKHQFHFSTSFAHTGKHNPISGNTCCTRASIFTSRHHIHTRTRLPQKLQNGLIGGGLHCVANQMIHAMQRVIKQLEMPQQCGGRIEIKRRANSSRNQRNTNVFGVQNAITI